MTARARYLEDTWKSYQAAEDAYERALLLDENNATAIAGYVENLAVWKYPLLSNDEVKLLQSALSSWTPQYWSFWLGLILVALVLFGRERLLHPRRWFTRRRAA